MKAHPTQVALHFVLGVAIPSVPTPVKFKPSLNCGRRTRATRYTTPIALCTKLATQCSKKQTSLVRFVVDLLSLKGDGRGSTVDNTLLRRFTCRREIFSKSRGPIHSRS